MTPEEKAELDKKKKKEKAEAKEKEKALPVNQALAWLSKLPTDITAAKQAIAKAHASATMPKSIRAECSSIFQEHLKLLEDARAKIEDTSCPGRDTGHLGLELQRASDCLHKFRADNKAFSKSCDVYVAHEAG